MHRRHQSRIGLAVTLLAIAVLTVSFVAGGGEAGASQSPALVAVVTNTPTPTNTPGAIPYADLAVTSVLNPPATVLAGGAFSVTDTTVNLGSLAAGPSLTGYFLWAPQKAYIFVGGRNVSALDSHQTSTGSAPARVPTTTAPRTYFLLVCANRQQLVSEIDLANNCAVAHSAVQVTAANTLTPTETSTSALTQTPTSVSTETPTSTPTDTAKSTSTESPTFTPTETPTSTSTETPTSTSTATSTFSWVKVQNRQIVDQSGNPILLRGFVTLVTNANGSPIPYTSADYQRMRSLGANIQTIQVSVGKYGAWPGMTLDPTYLAHLDEMVSLAKDAGIYTEFKMAVYDLPGMDSSRGLSAIWDAFWNVSSGTQDAVLAGWMTIWQRYVDDPYVVGYDLLNEPQQGTITADDTTFATQYLNVFYVRAIDQLRTFDNKHVVLFQPVFPVWNFLCNIACTPTPTAMTLIPPAIPPASYTVPVNRDQIVYAPHYYPSLTSYLNGSFTTVNYFPQMQQFLSEAAIQNAPLYIGEYSMPWRPEMDGNAQFTQNYVILERTATSLFLVNHLGFTRPWYNDDQAAFTLAGGNYSWGVIQGTGGLSGSFRTFITDIFTAAVTSGN